MLRDILKVYIPIVAILVAVGLVAWHLMAPPPPNDLVIDQTGGISIAQLAAEYETIAAAA